jgi:heme-degrading monooxygenase HmoA
MSSSCSSGTQRFRLCRSSRGSLHVGRPRDSSSREYLFITVWEDVESIRAFAGERWQEAVIAPDEEHLLKDTWIQHYETLQQPGSE